MTDISRLEGYRECHLCTIGEKMRARQCYYCSGSLDLKDLLLLEGEKKRRRKTAPVLSVFIPGLGHWYSGRRYVGTYFFAIAPLSIGLILATYQKWNWGLSFLTLSLLLVWCLAILDSKKGPSDYKPPCQRACPAEISSSRYVHMTAKGMDLEALELVESVCPFPGTIGRICPHPCEQECNRGKDGEPVAVCVLKRFVSDQADRPFNFYRRELGKNPQSRGTKIAVVGAGPSGLSASVYLGLFGFEVSLFEAGDHGGGSPLIYMPAFRLPVEVYREEVRRILELGFDLRFGTELGRDFTLEDLVKEGFKAVYLATGAMRSIKLPHTGEEKEGFLDGKGFLAKVRSGEDVYLDGDVLVIGGGNVAVDVARSAIRCGAEKVKIVCLEKKPEPVEKEYGYVRGEWREIKSAESVEYMPAFSWEIEDALKEGVEIVDGVATETFDIEEGRVRSANCLPVERIEKDQSGRIVPILRDSNRVKLKADWVLTAVGSSPDYSFLGDIPKTVPISDSAPLVDLKQGSTVNIPVIAGGDMASGPASVIEAVAAGKEAALYLYGKLVGSAPVSIRYRSRMTLEPWANYSDSPDYRRRRKERILPEKRRKNSFDEVYGGYTEGTAREEAGRCMRCDWPLMRESKVRKFFQKMKKNDQEKIS